MGSRTIINSPDFWEQKFCSGQWQAKKGHEHTQIYAQCLLDHLPEWIVEDIRKQHLSICDWGCAEGQAVRVYSECFPDSTICGVDVSKSAVGNASKRFPDNEFYAEDWLVNSTPVKQYDVVITSHVLEHFEHPVDIVIPRLLQFTKKYLVITVPFQEEEPLCNEHFYAFQYESFPAVVVDAVCSFFDVVAKGEYAGAWRGRQAIVVYEKNAEKDSSAIMELVERNLHVLEKERTKSAVLLENTRDMMAKLESCEMTLRNIKRSRSYRLIKRIQILLNPRRFGKEFVRILLNLLRFWKKVIRRYFVGVKERRLLSKRGKLELNLKILSKNQDCPGLDRKVAQNCKYDVACVMDTFTYDNIFRECNLHQLTPGLWRRELSANRPDFLFIESAWRGKDCLWRQRVCYNDHPVGVELDEILLWCKKQRIPTVFWNKEDPPHFEHFIGTAKKFDCIFTTAVECIERYKRHCGHDRIYTLLFAAQPRSQNPVLSAPRNNRVCFAGTYHNKKYKRRTEELCMLLRTAMNFGLDIYDRNYDAPAKKRKNYHFPPEFSSNILGSLEFDQMNNVYRRYRVFLNVNSVANSETMFARRVFELLASGTPVVSNYSRGIENVLGGFVHMAQTEEQTNHILERLLNDQEYWRRCSARGVRKVMREHTYRHRFLEILDALGADVYTGQSPSVTVILKAGGNHQLCIDTFKKQTFQPQKIIIAGETEGSEDLLRNLKAMGYNAEAWKRERHLESFQAECEGSLFAVMASKDYYGPEYLHDAVDAMGYCDADITAMRDVYREKGGAITFSDNPAYECTRTNTAVSATVVAKGAVLSSSLLEELLIQKSFKSDIPVYSRYGFEYAQLESSVDFDELLRQVCL